MKRTGSTLLLFLVYASFISLGLPDSVLGVAWPSMRAGWNKSLEAIGLVSLILTLCSAISSFASSRVLSALGTGKVVLLSGIMTGVSLLGFAVAPSFIWIFVLALPLGLGAGSVDSGLNHYVASHYSSRHMSWLHASWGIGATMGPLIMGWAILNPGWRGGYAVIAAIQLSLALCFAVFLPLWGRDGGKGGEREPSDERAEKGKTVPRWAVFLAPFAYFLYSAVELGTGLWAATILVETRGSSASDAALAVSFYYGALMVGRLLTGLVADRLGNRIMAKTGLILAALGAILFSLPAQGVVLSVTGLAFLGLGCAPVYPCLMHETPRRFDGLTARRVIGRQVAFAYLGAAVLPPSFGFLGARAGVGLIMPVVAVFAILLLLVVAALDSRT